MTPNSTPRNDGTPRRWRTRERGGTVRAGDRTLQVLSAFAANDRLDWALQDLASAAKLPKSTTHRLLETMCRAEFVVPGEVRGTYRLGLRAAVVGSSALRAFQPRQEVQAMLAEIGGRLRESTGLAVLSATDAVVVARADASRPLSVSLTVGTAIPAHTSAAGKVLLAGRSDEDVRRRYSGTLERRTATTLPTVDALLRALDEARTNGYALDDQETEIGLRCIAVPVGVYTGQVTHALSVSAPAARWEVNGLRNLLPALCETAARLAPPVMLTEKEQLG
jgi:DNA-binding IclR family transcriptional regulator